MKKFLTLPVLLFVLLLFVGCNSQTAQVSPQKQSQKPIAVLIDDGNLEGQTADQRAELDRVLQWMERDIVKQLSRAGFDAKLLNSKKEFQAEMGVMWKMTVKNFNAGNRALRAFVGYGAGASSLDMTYTLVDAKGKKIEQWDDGVGSSKGGTYCAQTLNRRNVKRLADSL